MGHLSGLIEPHQSFQKKPPTRNISRFRDLPLLQRSDIKQPWKGSGCTVPIAQAKRILDPARHHPVQQYARRVPVPFVCCAQITKATHLAMSPLASPSVVDGLEQSRFLQSARINSFARYAAPVTRRATAFALSCSGPSRIGISIRCRFATAIRLSLRTESETKSRCSLQQSSKDQCWIWRWQNGHKSFEGRQGHDRAACGPDTTCGDWIVQQ